MLFHSISEYTSILYFSAGIRLHQIFCSLLMSKVQHESFYTGYNIYATCCRM